MPELLHDPPLPPNALLVSEQPFLQRIMLVDRSTTLGSATWHTHGRDGVVQLVDLVVAPTAQRKGRGTSLLNETIAQAMSLFKSRGQELRRMWVAVEQKSQVIARSFFTRHGFHHTGTICDVFRKQDILIYLRSFD